MIKEPVITKNELFKNVYFRPPILDWIQIHYFVWEIKWGGTECWIWLLYYGLIFVPLYRTLFIPMLSIGPSSVTCGCSNGLCICTVTTFVRKDRLQATSLQFVCSFLIRFEKRAVYHKNKCERIASSGRGPVAYNPASYIGCSVFGFGHEDLLFWLRFLGLFFN
jgi:hypothetical protein